MVGAIVPLLANVHSNPYPLFAGLLLIPGIFVTAVLPLTGWVALPIVVLVNAGAWYFYFRPSPPDDESTVENA
jgi:hypothetical protein